MPDYLSEDCQDLINNLIVKDKEKRIKLDQVLMHPWIQKNTSNWYQNYLFEMKLKLKN
jgi:aurora kinase